METSFSNLAKGGFQRAKKCVLELEFTSGVATVIAVSAVLFIVSTFCHIPADVGSLDSSAVLKGNVQRLFTYSFFHEDAWRLLLGAGALLLLGGGLERGLGTVRFLYLLLLLPACAGLLYALLEPLLFGAAARGCVLGLVPAALSLQGAAVTRSLMRRAILFGINVPALALPWVFLLIAHLIPGDVLLCNALAVIVGQIYGKGWLALLTVSESRASLLDKKMPFRLLRKLPGVTYMPACVEERRRTTHRLCKPAPGSYPVQAYAPVSSTLPTQAVGTLPQMYDGWKHSTCAQESYAALTLHHGPSAGWGRHHSQWQTYPAQHSSHHCTQGSTCAHSHAGSPAAFAPPPVCYAAPLTVPAGGPSNIPGTPQVSLVTHGGHGLPP
ncbi:rhomboid domain-containing protein 2 [Brienomyrus brachyistius]|uniref:rhomboid domain-containing protein 2 n=1 Tax=Brienomyrus brachyistius TaxID=42636 RepID=UPI0020B1FD21|nr:rhomboid domain-containing protein 2 [Brienomyrus brachyistius]